MGVGIGGHAIGLKFCPGGHGVKLLKRWRNIRLLLNFEIPIHRLTSDPGSTVPFGHPLKSLS